MNTPTPENPPTTPALPTPALPTPDEAAPATPEAAAPFPKADEATPSTTPSPGASAAITPATPKASPNPATPTNANTPSAEPAQPTPPTAPDEPATTEPAPHDSTAQPTADPATPTHPTASDEPATTEPAPNDPAPPPTTEQAAADQPATPTPPATPEPANADNPTEPATQTPPAAPIEPAAADTPARPPTPEPAVAQANPDPTSTAAPTATGPAAPTEPPPATPAEPALAAPAQPTIPEPPPPAIPAAVTYPPTPGYPFPAHTPPPGYAYPAQYPQPPIPEPPKPPGPPKSTPAAILLNLTGLGLGYAYLRRRLFLAIALVGTAGLVTAAFLTDAAGNPWLWRLLTIGWLALLALHAGLIGRRHLPATSKTSTVVGVAAAAVIVAGYVGYGIAGNTVYTSGVDAQKAGDCATALDRFDTVTGPFELTLSENVSAAENRTAECNAYASALTAQKNGNHDAAITQYKEFGENYPQSVLRTFVHDNLAETYVNRVLDWQLPLAERTTIDSGNTLLMVLRDFADTPAAARVPKALTDLFEAANSAYRDADFCGALTTLDYFAKLDPSVAQDVVTAANTDRARALYECGISQVRGGYAQASTTLQTFLTDYPQDPGVPQAKSAHITAQVALALNVTLPVPPPLGDNSPGDIPVTFYNDSNTAVTILVAGPTAHELTLPPCVVCPATYPPGVEPCPTFDGRPSVTLELTPATYYLLTGRETGSIDSYSGSITPLVGYEHTQCMYVGQG